MSEIAVSEVNSALVAQRFGQHQRLSVRQKKSWLEAIVNFEFRNKYDVYDEDSQAVLRVQETEGGIFELVKRMFLGPTRSFTAHVTDIMSDQVTLVLDRPWRLIFHRLDIYSGNGEKLGAIQKKWSWVRRIYVVEDAVGNEVAELFGPFFKPWTFEVRKSGAKIGQISKRWSGLGTEIFTDADNFGIDMGGISDPTLKALAFAATVLIDVVHFERRKNN